MKLVDREGSGGHGVVGPQIGRSESYASNTFDEKTWSWCLRLRACRVGRGPEPHAQNAGCLEKHGNRPKAG